MAHRDGRRGCRSDAFTLVEVLVVIAIVTVLIALLFPALSLVRARAKATQCASNLHQISQAFAGYCAENRGVTPRYGLYNTPSLPLWLEVIPPHHAAPKNFDWADLPKVGVLQCPSHPTAKIPSGYVLNAFAFETAPAWDGSPPVPMAKVRNTAGVAWLMEAADMFGPSEYLFDAIFFEPYHIVRTPDQLLQRVHAARHGRRGSNVLFADGHVGMIAPGDLKLDMLDDGIRQR